MKNIPLLTLASGSKARADILTENGFNFIVHPADIDEDNYNIKPVSELVLRLAIDKCKHIARQNPQHIILAADSLISLVENSIEIVLGKPKDNEHAQKMLESLSGKVHFATTGVCLYNPYNKQFYSDFEVTRVKFKNFSKDIINQYIATGESLGKCGSYGIQGAAKDLLLDKVIGNIDNVRGLPMNVVKQLLGKAGYLC